MSGDGVRGIGLEVPVKVATPRNRMYPHLQSPWYNLVEAMVLFGLSCVVC